MSMKPIEKYRGKKLTTDEIAIVRAEIDRLTKELEDFEYKTGDDHLLLKWGTLKSWSLNSERGKGLLKEYFTIGSNESAMVQKDTDKQKELICQMIDECDGVIQSDWTGEYFTKKEAKKYITEYKT